jgi:2,5-diketo-D-gluconate reductase A
MLEAYSPLSRISSEGNKAISDIATRYSKSPQQLVLRWCIAHGTLPLPRSTNPDHIESNFDVFDFKINENDLRTLDSLSDGGRVTWDPAGMGQ